MYLIIIPKRVPSALFYSNKGDFMWPKSYKDYPIDTPLIKQQVRPGKGIIGCEMHELNGWGLLKRKNDNNNRKNDDKDKKKRQ
jgi:hypothetical protein